MKRIIFGLMGIVLLCCASSQANILVSFNFDNSTGNASAVAAGLAATPFATAVGSANWLDHSGNGKAIGAAGFVSSGNYFTFMLTVAAGYQLNVTGLQFDDKKEQGMNASQWRADYKVGNGSFFNGPTGDVHGHNDWGADDKTLSGLGNLQNTTLTFHLAPTDASNNNKNWYLDNVIINGTVMAIPEPTTVALLGLGAMALMRSRKK
ncbi:MAG: PEP-CTERM sorting domain-containing protein [Sedimentisphaerales bacterium]|nr:PEP-CTERM sorting domain-containing protein [Sedimentisphaerales bacterium]